SSGIGLATARMAARRGAKVIVAARNQEAIRRLCDEIRTAGGDARWVNADVSREEDLGRIAAEAIGHFGRIDSWVNNAGVSIYGKALDISIADARKLFETNFWGVVYGSRVAMHHLRQNGGALINVGSVVSDTAVPLQSYYVASKHALKGFTDALRMETENDKIPVSVTTIKPGPIDTPYTQHAKNYLEDEPSHAPPVYDPDLVADAILHAAEHPVRDLYVGGGAKGMSVLGRFAPRFADKYMEKVLAPKTHSGRPREARGDALHSHSFGGEQRGNYDGTVRRTSAYTTAAMHPAAASAIGFGAAFAIGSLLRSRTRVK
ncbi:MAG TPA: SDR family oxidoreductase, partial [Opitutus sp.]|nr:SDR family oxidoreductase [Opitutus sp.]